jgi:hypothetical protein
MVRLLKLVDAENDVNMMDLQNLATIFGGMSGIFFPLDLSDPSRTALLLKLLTHSNEIFSGVRYAADVVVSCSLVGWFVGWLFLLVGWLVGWLVVLVGWLFLLVGWLFLLVGGLVGWLFLLVGGLVGWLCLLTYSLLSPPNFQAIDEKQTKVVSIYVDDFTYKKFQINGVDTALTLFDKISKKISRDQKDFEPEK